MTSRLRIAFQTDATLAEYAELGQLVDRYDFDALTAYEDLFHQPAWPALVQFAQHTRNVRIGPSVVNPYLVHPAVTAANLAVIDQASGGRAYLGIGRGAFFEPIAVPQPRAVQAVREAIDVIQRMLTGDRAPYEGVIFRAGAEAYLHFESPGRHVPVLIGGWGPRILALAGEVADEVKIGGCVNPEAAATFRERIAVGERAAGRAPGSVRLIYGAVTVLDDDAKRAERIARARVASYVAVIGGLDPVYTIDPSELAMVQTGMAEGAYERAAAALSEATLRRYSCYGDADGIVRRLEELFAAGVDQYEIGAPHGVDVREAIIAFGERVAPAFAN